MQKQILVMEDNDNLRDIYAKTLHKYGYHTHPAATLQQARDLLRHHHFDLLLCDIQMGDDLGIDLVRGQLSRLNENGTHVVMVSAEVQYRPTCQEIGIDFFMEKPVSLSELVILVDCLTAKRKK